MSAARRPLASLGSSNAMDGAPKDTRETKAVMGAIEKERGLRDMQEVSVCCARLVYAGPPSLTSGSGQFLRLVKMPTDPKACQQALMLSKRSAPRFATLPARKKRLGSDDRCACCQS